MATPELQRSRALVAEHLDTLFRVAYRLTHNKPDAQDLVQDTCVAAAGLPTMLPEIALLTPLALNTRVIVSALL